VLAQKQYLSYPLTCYWAVHLSLELIGRYTIDTLQIYFPWDDDLYTYFKEQGFGQKGIMRKALPLIYTDNCESTTDVTERSRKYVILPQYFGETFESLGWKETERKTEPIITSERPIVEVSLDNNQDLKFKVIPRVDDKEQYHIEYSSMAAFGSMYTNWSIIVLKMDDFQDIFSKLKTCFPKMPSMIDIPVYKESKQAQREELFFVEIPIESYKFSIGEFRYAGRYLELNGIRGCLPSLIYKNEPEYRQTMEPILKLGFIHTKGEKGFELRKPQCALKIAQPKVSISKRGKKAKMKGKIVCIEPYENYYAVPAKTFFMSAMALRNADPLSLNK
jgi:hypothetical protein